MTGQRDCVDGAVTRGRVETADAGPRENQALDHDEETEGTHFVPSRLRAAYVHWHYGMR